ncbi:murein hydrolase activator EnvC family protein [Agromyces larvae]|uniref:M23 family metallopeptidase n=1 Tax=Agromyces larvae TaxID=2929802 RepID=A0ABY4C1N5_9MICO|nr:M23 family metallopeptidase [Agromyces larvae]UOE45352.1 M23 family metallopeptidase [Agromyces larvae]
MTRRWSTPVVALLAARALMAGALVAGMPGAPAAMADGMPAAAQPATAAEPAAAAEPAGAAEPSAATQPRWRWPVPSPIVVLRPFRAPATPYASGHRGIDLDVPPGATVSAPAGGVVAFAGMVAGRGVITVDHGEGVLSSYEPITSAVAVGDAVRPGDPIGSVATGGHCGAGCLHFGVRVDGEYVSPFRFLGGVPRAVLLPWRDD